MGWAVNRAVGVLAVRAARRVVSRGRKVVWLVRGCPVWRVVDLKGQVRDAVLPGEQGLEVGADRVAVLAGFDEHVRGGGGHSGRYLPHMQVMNLRHVRPRGH